MKKILSISLIFNRSGLPFGLKFGSKFDAESKKIRLKGDFQKTAEKYTFWGRTSTLPKSKTIAKRWEGRSKYFKKSDPETPHFGEVFGLKIDPRSRKSGLEIVTKIKTIFHQIFYRFWLHFGPMGHPKIEYFSSNFALGVALGPSWRQEGAQSAPGQLQRSNFLEFCTILGSILEDLSMIFGYIFIQLPGWSHIRWYLFYNITVANFQLAALIFSLGTVAAWRAQRTG